MNILIITNENHIKNSLSHKFFPVGINVIHFKKCADAIQHLNKINPHVIIVDTDTEQRAWKPLITIIRSGKTSVPIVFLLIMSNCDIETANQALYLGVNGIILKPFNKVKSILKIIKLIKRHIDIEKARNFIRIKPSIDDSIMFMYKDINTRSIIKGQVNNLSANGLGINLNMAYQDFNIEKDEILENCILKIKGEEIRFDLSVIWHHNRSIGGKFVNINKLEFVPLYEYLLNKLSDTFQMSKNDNIEKSINMPDSDLAEINKNVVNNQEKKSEEERSIKEIKEHYNDMKLEEL